MCLGKESAQNVCDASDLHKAIWCVPSMYVADRSRSARKEERREENGGRATQLGFGSELMYRCALPKTCESMAWCRSAMYQYDCNNVSARAKSGRRDTHRLPLRL